MKNGSLHIGSVFEYFAFGELQSNREHSIKSKTCEQTFIEERNDAEYTRYLFNGKELDEETGNYYYGARYYNPQTSIWLSVDPLADEMPMWSPYTFSFNNPIKMVDPDGRAPQHIDVTKNDDGTYTVAGGKANADKNIYVVDGDGNRTGEVVGEMLTEYSFHHEDGSAVVGTNIDLNDQSGRNFFNDEIKGIGLFEYMGNAKGGEPLDFKVRDMPDGLTPEASGQYTYRGMSFDGKVASARDIGNYAAGYVAGKSGFGWGTSRLAFDALETKQKIGTLNTLMTYPLIRAREGAPTQHAQHKGHQAGSAIHQQIKLDRQWKKATNPWPTGPKY